MVQGFSNYNDDDDTATTIIINLNTWVLDVRWHLLDNEIQGLATLMYTLEKVFLSVSNNAKRLWALNSKGRFPVKSFYEVLFGEQANYDRLEEVVN